MRTGAIPAGAVPSGAAARLGRPEARAGRPDPRAGRNAAARLGRLASRALLREVAAAPKPGLVDRFGSGSHDDMDFMTFADSALALESVFSALARAGIERGAACPAWASSSVPLSDDAAFLASLRPIGVEGEVRMFAATGGVNTHKGALFLVGLLAASAGALVGAGLHADAGRIRSLAARIARGVSGRELPAADSHGARAFRAYGSRGVRGEAEDGLPSLDGGALRVLRAAYAAGRRPADADCVEALLLIMLRCDDTTVLHRGGAAALDFARRGAMGALALGGPRTEEGRAQLSRLSSEFAVRRISPGGAADALAAALFLVQAEREFGARAAQGRLRRQLRNVARDLRGRDGRRDIQDDVLRGAVPAL